MELEFLIPVVLITLIMVIAIIANSRFIKAIIRDWEAIAEALGLRYTSHLKGLSIGHIAGTYRGLNVLIDHYTTGSKNKTTYTRIRTSAHKRLPQGIKLYAETPIFSSIGKFFGGQDIQTGDPAFDKAFIIKGASEHEVQALLSPTVRDALLRYHRVAPLNLDEEGLLHTEARYIRDVNRVRHILDAQREAMVALCGGEPRA